MGAPTIQSSAKESTRQPWPVILGLLFFITCCVVLVGVISGPSVIGAIGARNWVATPCVMLASEVKESPSDRDGDSSASTTSRVDVRYRYTWNGQEFVGDRYQWSRGYTAFGGKEQELHRLSPGTQTTSYVNPANPAESVLHRGVGWDAAIGLIFAMFGFFAALFLVRGLRGQPQTSPHAMEPAPGEMVIDFARNSRTAVAFLTCFALAWNGIAWPLFLTNLPGAGGSFLSGAFSLAGIGPFVLIGLALLVLAACAMLSLRNPTASLRLSKSAPRLGESLQIAWRLVGRTDHVASLDLSLESRRIVEEVQGNTRRVITRILARLPIAHTTRPAEIASGQATIQLPSEYLPTAGSRDDKVRWYIMLHGQVSGAPDFRHETDLDIAGPTSTSTSASAS